MVLTLAIAPNSSLLCLLLCMLKSPPFLTLPRSHGTNCGAIWFCHIPFCPEVKGMPIFEWLKIKEGKTSGNPKKNPGIPKPFLSCFTKRNKWYLHGVRCQDDFRMGFLLCEFGRCKTAKMRVGAHLGPMLEILMGNLPWNFDNLCMKEVTTGSISGGAKFWKNSFFLRFATLNYTAKQLVPWDP